VAGGCAFLAGMPQLGWAVFAVVLINGTFSFLQEYRAERALEALERLLPTMVTVVRGGRTGPAPAESLVPGDVIEIGEGDRVPADGQVLVRSVLLSLDAANRAWMQGATYRAALNAGELMSGYGLGEVVESRRVARDLVMGELGWRECAGDAKASRAAARIGRSRPALGVGRDGQDGLSRLAECPGHQGG
jgi:hypothetical protein